MKVNKTLVEDTQLNKMQNDLENKLDDTVDKIEDDALAAAKVLDKEIADNLKESTKGLMAELDRALRVNVNSKPLPGSKWIGPLNILIEGPAGIGKSGIISDWAESRHVHLVTITGAELTTDLVQGIGFRVEDTDDEYQSTITEKNKAIRKVSRIERQIQRMEGKSMSDAEEQEFEALEEQRDELYEFIEGCDNSLASSKKKMSAKLITMDFFQKLMEPNSVLFIDEINRSNANVRAAVLDIIQSHNIPDSTTDTNRRFADNFLFTIAAQNPSSLTYEGARPLDLAMLTRFQKYTMELSVSDTKKYLTRVINHDIEYAEANIGSEIEKLHKKEWMEKHTNKDGTILSGVFYEDFASKIVRLKNILALMNTLLSDANIEYDFDPDKEAAAKDAGDGFFNARTLTTALFACDGTKESFLRIFPECCGHDKDLFQKVQLALKDYKPVADMPNKALVDAGELSDDVFKDFDAENNIKAKRNDLNILLKGFDSQRR